MAAAELAQRAEAKSGLLELCGRLGNRRTPLTNHRFRKKGLGWGGGGVAGGPSPTGLMKKGWGRAVFSFMVSRRIHNNELPQTLNSEGPNS